MSNPKIYHPNHTFINQPLANLSNLDFTLKELQGQAPSQPLSLSQPSPPLIGSQTLSPSDFLLNVNSSTVSPTMNNSINFGLGNEFLYPLFGNPSQNLPAGYIDPLLSCLTNFNVTSQAPLPSPDLNSNSETDLLNEFFNLPTSPSPSVATSTASKRKPVTVSKSETAKEVEDAAARKRRQNTLAARRSRQRKVQKMEEMENSIARLEKDKIQLETKIAILESEKESFAKREAENLERIRALEAQLLEAFKASRA